MLPQQDQIHDLKNKMRAALEALKSFSAENPSERLENLPLSEKAETVLEHALALLNSNRKISEDLKNGKLALFTSSNTTTFHAIFDGREVDHVV